MYWGPIWSTTEIQNINNSSISSSIIYSNAQGVGSLNFHLWVWWEILYFLFFIRSLISNECIACILRFWKVGASRVNLNPFSKMWSLQKLNITSTTMSMIYRKGHLVPPLSEPPGLASWTEAASMINLVEIYTQLCSGFCKWFVPKPCSTHESVHSLEKQIMETDTWDQAEHWRAPMLVANVENR